MGDAHYRSHDLFPGPQWCVKKTSSTYFVSLRWWKITLLYPRPFGSLKSIPVALFLKVFSFVCTTTKSEILLEVAYHILSELFGQIGQCTNATQRTTELRVFFLAKLTLFFKDERFGQEPLSQLGRTEEAVMA